MKGFFSLFVKSFNELKNVKCLAITGIFIAVSMVIETFTIELPYCKINFAFLAIAVVGMMYGPFVCMLSGFACDIVGYLVHPQGAFIPIYIIVAGLQGLIYGIVLYRKRNKYNYILRNNETGKDLDITLFLRAIIARLLDVVVINLLINTKLNMYFGFIPKQAYGEAIVARTAKNVIELIVDLPLMFILLPVAANAFARIMRTKRLKNT